MTPSMQITVQMTEKELLEMPSGAAVLLTWLRVRGFVVDEAGQLIGTVSTWYDPMHRRTVYHQVVPCAHEMING